MSTRWKRPLAAPRMAHCHHEVCHRGSSHRARTRRGRGHVVTAYAPSPLPAASEERRNLAAVRTVGNQTQYTFPFSSLAWRFPPRSPSSIHLPCGPSGGIPLSMHALGLVTLAGPLSTPPPVCC